MHFRILCVTNVLVWAAHIILRHEPSEVASIHHGALVDQLVEMVVVQEDVMVSLDFHYLWKVFRRINDLMPQLEVVSGKLTSIAKLDPPQELVEALDWKLE